MKNIKYSLLLLAALSLASCSDFLNREPDGIYTEKDVNTPENVDKLVIAAYADLGNDHYDAPLSLWCWGNVRSDDAYKGGRDESDQQETHFYETATDIRDNMSLPDALWFRLYKGISRCNTALRALNNVSEKEFELKNQRIGEMHFLRGHFYFMLKELFKHVPFVESEIPAEFNDDLRLYVGSISNVEYTNDELWQKIADDFKIAYDNLPESKEDIGRPDKYAAAAYLAKTYLYKAYRQDEQHNVIEVNEADLEQVLIYTQYVMSSPYGLESDYAHNFLPGEYENGREAIFSVQFSTGDGTMFGRLNFSDVLNASQGIGGSDFHKPSQNLVNAFKTENGLPMFDTFNNTNYGYNGGSNPLDDFHNAEGKVDPRLFHTVALPGYPYKYDYETYETDWNRNIGVYGIYSSLKENVSPESDSFVQMTPFVANSKNRIVIRYADVMLMRAEALTELGRDLSEALDLVNQIRRRAANSTAFIEYAEDKIEIAEYDGSYATQDKMREVVRWERRLELAMEGSRFFDLTRWGVAAETMNAYYGREQTTRPYLRGAHFDKNKEEFVPVPQQQISFSKNLYQQNYGY